MTGCRRGRTYTDYVTSLFLFRDEVDFSFREIKDTICFLALSISTHTVIAHGKVEFLVIKIQCVLWGFVMIIHSLLLQNRMYCIQTGARGTTPSLHTGNMTVWFKYLCYLLLYFEF